MPNISCVDNNGQKLEQQRSSSISSNPFQFVKCSGSQDLTHTAETQLEMSENLMNLRHSQSFDGADSDCEWQLNLNTWKNRRKSQSEHFLNQSECDEKLMRDGVQTGRQHNPSIKTFSQMEKNRTRRKLSTLKPFYPISDDDDVAAQPFMPSLPESSVMCGKLIMDGVMAGCSPVIKNSMFCADISGNIPQCSSLDVTNRDVQDGVHKSDFAKSLCAEDGVCKPDDNMLENKPLVGGNCSQTSISSPRSSRHFQQTPVVLVQSSCKTSAQSNFDMSTLANYNVSAQLNKDVFAQSNCNVSALTNHNDSAQLNYAMHPNSSSFMAIHSDYEMSPQPNYDMPVQSSYVMFEQSSYDMFEQPNYGIYVQSGHCMSHQSSYDMSLHPKHGLSEQHSHGVSAQSNHLSLSPSNCAESGQLNRIPVIVRAASRGPNHDDLCCRQATLSCYTATDNCQPIDCRPGADSDDGGGCVDSSKLSLVTSQLDVKYEGTVKGFVEKRIKIKQKPSCRMRFGFTLSQKCCNPQPVFVEKLLPGSAADVCELQTDDEVLAVDGVDVAGLSSVELEEKVWTAAMLGHVEMRVKRSSELDDQDYFLSSDDDVDTPRSGSKSSIREERSFSSIDSTDYRSGQTAHLKSLSSDSGYGAQTSSSKRKGDNSSREDLLLFPSMDQRWNSESGVPPAPSPLHHARHVDGDDNMMTSSTNDASGDRREACSTGNEGMCSLPLLEHDICDGSTISAAGVMPTCSCVMVSGDTVATAGTGLPVLLRKWQRQLPSYTSAYKTDHISEQFYEQLKGSSEKGREHLPSEVFTLRSEDVQPTVNNSKYDHVMECQKETAVAMSDSTILSETNATWMEKEDQRLNHDLDESSYEEAAFHLEAVYSQVRKPSPIYSSTLSNDVGRLDMARVMPAENTGALSMSSSSANGHRMYGRRKSEPVNSFTLSGVTSVVSFDQEQFSNCAGNEHSVSSEGLGGNPGQRDLLLSREDMLAMNRKATPLHSKPPVSSGRYVGQFCEPVRREAPSRGQLHSLNFVPKAKFRQPEEWLSEEGPSAGHLDRNLLPVAHRKYSDVSQVSGMNDHWLIEEAERRRKQGASGAELSRFSGPIKPAPDICGNRWSTMDKWGKDGALATRLRKTLIHRASVRREGAAVRREGGGSET